MTGVRSAWSCMTLPSDNSCMFPVCFFLQGSSESCVAFECVIGLCPKSEKERNSSMLMWWIKYNAVSRGLTCFTRL